MITKSISISCASRLRVPDCLSFSLSLISIPRACLLSTAAWNLRNEQSNCVLIAPRSTDQLYLHLNALKVLAKLTPALMEEVEAILSNKPMEKRRGASLSDKSGAAGATSSASAVALAAAATVVSAADSSTTTATHHLPAAASPAAPVAGAGGGPVPV